MAPSSSRTMPRTHCRESLGDDDPARRLDQREVGKRLREVPEMAARAGVELLGVEPKRRGDAQELLHQVAGTLLLADDRESRNEPERADQEAPLLPGQAVVGLAGAIAQDKSVLGQVIGDRLHRLAHAL